MNNYREIISTWKWVDTDYEYCATYQNGYDRYGYDAKGFAPDGLDRFGFDKSGYLDAYGGLYKKDFRTTRDGRKNKYTHTYGGIVVVFPRSELTYYNDYYDAYCFYDDYTFGIDSINYMFFDSYAAYKEYMEEQESEEGYGDLDELYNIGFGGDDWGI